MITYTKKPVVGNVFIDRLSVTLKIESQYHTEVINSLHEHIDNGYGTKAHTSQYLYSMRLGLGEKYDRSTLVQCSPHPHLGDVAFFRIEFNPERLGSNGLSELRLRLDSILPFGYETIVHKGMCTRFDATVDIRHLEIDKLCFRYPGMQLSKAYYKQGKIDNYRHELESYYLGGDNSARQICIYDKAQQIKAYNAVHPLMKKPLPNSPVTRVEVRNKNRQPLLNLPSVPNQFEKLDVFSFHKLPTTGYEFDLFIKVVRAEGLQNALLGLPESVRKKYRKRLDVAKSTFWNPEEHWNNWPSIVQGILYPTVSALALQ